ncbi:putative acyltransferase [Gordonia hirsuta DSM 44140 = NBRC 16056]|uniref:Putative acyltransferase n=1 Tax=Gordonia hirsuta DSM 44140 = NBRC 16056 TaxID=1121927 RepID=L7L854_9ACTN|nr:acyltransferase family protein [Gordonia hirsuta]GAC57089.1 putative acyltransferase [Gordonia hirsuta DSM 44140 = NBRC 16056]
MPRPTHNQTSYLPALDGLRALAVIFVVLYHLDVPGFSGGLLGVGMFFTLSGYLITSLLVFSHERTGGLGLKSFWIRRFRRLMPASILVLVATLVTSAIALPKEFLGYLWEALSALFYVNNWYTIFSNDSYFDRFGGPSPLSHMWSLSIEEQFYIFWPLMMLAMYAVIKRRMGMTILTVILALISFYLLYSLASPAFDNTRAYEGTDTRAGGLLLGAAMAFWWPARKHSVDQDRRTWLDVAGLAGIAAIVYLVITTGDNSMSLYSWGIAALTLATMAILAAAVAPDTLVANLLSLPPLVWIGERSYGLYLWHMPVVAFVPLAVRTDSPWLSVPLVVGLTVLLAALSWRYLEDPIRRYGFRNALTGRHDDPDPHRSPVVSPRSGPTPDQNAETTAADPADPPADAPDSVPAGPVRVSSIVEQPIDLSDVLTGGHTLDDAAADDQTAETELSSLDEGPAPAAEPAHDSDSLPLEMVVLEMPAIDADETPDPDDTLDPDDSLDTDGAEGAEAPVAEATADTEGPAIDEKLVVVIPDPRPRTTRRRLRRSVGSVLGLLSLAVAVLVGTTMLHPDMAVVRALSFEHQEDIGDLVDESATAPVGPTLPAAQRRTECTEVIHVGDSTALGMTEPEMQPDPRKRLTAQYTRVGAKVVRMDVVGGRSSLERLEGAPNAAESIQTDLDNGWEGCWVMNMGINDAANMEVGGPGPAAMRIDRLLSPLKGQPVLWPTVITNQLNQNPAYNNRAMQRFNRALVEACKRYPNLRIYDLAGEVDQSWFSDGVHFTAEGNVQRARMISTALATAFPAEDQAPDGCLIKSIEPVVETPAEK